MVYVQISIHLKESGLNFIYAPTVLLLGHVLN